MERLRVEQLDIKRTKRGEEEADGGPVPAR